MSDRTFRAFAQITDYRNSLEIMFAFETPTGRAYAKPVVFEMEEQEGEWREPSLRLKRNEGQTLMDALWDAGLRPTQGEGSAGSLAATERHLADMRQLVFKVSP